MVAPGGRISIQAVHVMFTVTSTGYKMFLLICVKETIYICDTQPQEINIVYVFICKLKLNNSNILPVMESNTNTSINFSVASIL